MNQGSESCYLRPTASNMTLHKSRSVILARNSTITFKYKSLRKCHFWASHIIQISPSYLKGTPSHVLPVVLRIEKTLNQNNALFSNIYSTSAKPARHKQEHHGVPF